MTKLKYGYVPGFTIIHINLVFILMGKGHLDYSEKLREEGRKKLGEKGQGKEEYRRKKPFLCAYHTVSPFHLPNFVRLRT